IVVIQVKVKLKARRVDLIDKAYALFERFDVHARFRLDQQGDVFIVAQFAQALVDTVHQQFTQIDRWVADMLVADEPASKCDKRHVKLTGNMDAAFDEVDAAFPTREVGGHQRWFVRTLRSEKM